MTRSILLAVLLAFSTVTIAAPAWTVISNANAAPKVEVKTKKQSKAKKVEQKKEEAPVTYKKPTRKKVVKK